MNFKSPHFRTGLTLLELLLVVFILSTIALSAVSLVDGLDEQSRFDDTKRRWQEIRKAIVGDPDQTINGEPAISGFVADVGRLPFSIEELLDRGSLPPWQLNADTGIWSGWRGPYLNAAIENNTGLPAFRDGWGNPTTVISPDYGWKIFLAEQADGNPDVLPTTLFPAGTMIRDGDLFLQSYGSDQSEGAGSTSTYEEDYPAYTTRSDIDIDMDSSLDIVLNTGLLVRRDDHQVNINSRSVTIRLKRLESTTTLPTGDEDLKLRLHYPIDGEITGYVDSGSVALVVTDLSTNLSADGYHELTFTFPGTNRFIPWGVRSLQLIVDDGDSDDANDAVYDSVEPHKTINFIPRRAFPSSPMTWKIIEP